MRDIFVLFLLISCSLTFTQTKNREKITLKNKPLEKQSAKANKTKKEKQVNYVVLVEEFWNLWKDIPEKIAKSPKKIEKKVVKFNFAAQIKKIKVELASVPQVVELFEKHPSIESCELTIGFLKKLDITESPVFKAYLKLAYNKDKKIKQLVHKEIEKYGEKLYKSYRIVLKTGTKEEKEKVASLLLKRGIKEIEVFIELLLSTNTYEQELAKKNLIAIGPIGVSRLIRLIEENPDPILQKNVAFIWKKMGKVAIPEFVLQLKKNGKRSKKILIDIVSSFGADAIPSMISVLRLDQSKELQSAIIEIFIILGPTQIASALKLYDDPIPAIKKTAKAIVKKFGKKCIPFLIKSLKGKNKKLKNYSLMAIADMGEEASEALDDIKPLLNKKSAFQYSAVLAIKNMGKVSAKVIPELKKAFRSEDPSIRAAAAHAIGNAGEKALSALTLLIRNLKTEEYGETRTEICRAIGKMGSKAKKAIPNLIRSLEDVDEMVVQAAAEALGKMGPVARSAIDPLMQVLVYYGAAEREIAAKAIANMGRSAIYKLQKTLRYGEEAGAREGAALALGYMGKKAKSAVRSLILALRIDIDLVKRAAARALGQIGPVSSASMRALVEASKDESSFVREEVAKALPKMGKNVIPRILIALRRFRDKNARITLIKSLGNIGSPDYNVLPTLIRYLGQWTGAEQKEIVRTLIKFKKESSDALPNFIEILRDSDDNEMHTLVIKALLILGDESITHIIPLLKERNGLAQDSAVFILKKLNKQATPYLIQFAKTSKDDLLTAKIITILAENPKTLDTLIGMINHESEKVRDALIEAFGKIGQPAIFKLIDIILTSTNIDKLDTVRRALVKIGTPTVLPLVKKLESSEKPIVREIILATIGDIGSKATAAVIPLTKIIAKWQGYNKRLMVAQCLGKIGVAAIPYLVKLLTKGDKELQGLAIIGLGETKSPDAIMYLLRSLKNPNLLSLVIGAMLKMKELAVPLLIKEVDDEDRNIRFACAAALLEIRDKKALTALKKREKKEKDPMVKYIISLAIKSLDKKK